MSSEWTWTDQCFLVVCLLGFLLLLRGVRQASFRASMRFLFSKPVAVSTSLILISFLFIGILDSIPNKAGTCLDYLLSPLGTQYEKTYSAPFSLTSSSSETMYVDGHAVQTYSRLKYLPSFIQTAKDRQDVLLFILVGAFLVSIGVVIGVKLLTQYAGCAFIPWKTALMTLFMLSFIGITLYLSSRYFHVFGTGKIGQDIFYYTLKSIRTGLVIGILTTLFMMPLALLLGISAGYFGGIVDDVIQYIYTTLSSIPSVLLIAASVLSMKTYIATHPLQFQTLAQSADARLLALCLILGVTSWTSLCRLLRAESLKLKEIDFVLAAKALGTRPFYIIMKHLLPNVMHLVLITLVLDFSFLVLAEVVLSYVGVGVSPMTMSWGNMINAARLELAREPVVWWPMTAAFGFMFVLVLASNLFADVVREMLDPHRVN